MTGSLPPTSIADPWSAGRIEESEIFFSGRLRDSGRLVHEVLAGRARRHPDRVMMTFVGDRSYTAAEVQGAASQLAGALQRAGVGPQERVAMYLDNRVEFLAAFFGISAAGAVSVPINTEMRGDILAYQLRQTAPVLLIVQAEHLGKVVPALSAVPSLRTIVVLGGRAEDRPIGAWSAVAFEEFVRDAPAPVPAGQQPWDLAAIFYTSGTTGPSKGVMWTHNFCVHFTELARWIFGYGPRDVVFTCLPMFHGNALFLSVFPAIHFDAHGVVAARFSPSQFWPQVAGCEATVTSMLGAMAPLLMAQPESDLDRAHRLRLALVVPTPGDPAGFERRFGLPTTELYGLSDVGVVLAVPHGCKREHSAGLPIPGWECRLFDDDDHEVPDGEAGELVVRPERTYTLPLGYWEMPEATLGSRANLWMHTGDLMRRDADGWFYFLDRKKDALRRSGENVSSYEVEQVLLAHPAVTEAAVYAAPSDTAEDEVMAAIVLEKGATATPAEIIAFAEPRLPYFSVPRYVDIRDALPKTQTAKVQKNVLRAQGVTATTWDRGPSGRKARAERAQASRPM